MKRKGLCPEALRRSRGERSFAFTSSLGGRLKNACPTFFVQNLNSGRRNKIIKRGSKMIVTRNDNPLFKPAGPEDLACRKEYTDWQNKESEARGDIINSLPEWLKGGNLKAFLESSLFYPGDGADSQPITYMKEFVSNFIYVVDWEPFGMCDFLRSIAPGVQIYKFPLETMINLKSEELKQEQITTDIEELRKKSIFGVSYKDGNKLINIICIPFKPSIVHRELYLRRKIAIKVFTHIINGFGTGCDFYYHLPWGDEIFKNQAGSPEFILGTVDRDGGLKAHIEGPLKGRYEPYRISESPGSQLQLYQRR